MTKTTQSVHSFHSLLLDVPKIDLHCHLNGSISGALLTYLQKLRNGNSHKSQVTQIQKEKQSGSCAKDVEAPYVKTSLSQDTITLVDPQTRMHECFKMFDLIYTIMDNLTFTKLAVQDLLFHAAMQRVCVLQIRTSLRDAMRASYQLDSSNITSRTASKQQYLQIVIDTVEHLLTGHGVVCFNSGALLNLNQMTPAQLEK